MMGDYELDLDSDPGILSNAVAASRRADTPATPNSEPSDSEQNALLSREVGLQAALQAERQEAALMRKALEERERELNNLTNQCETLENKLEDRDRDMDHLTRKIEQAGTEIDSYTSDSPEAFESRLAQGSQYSDSIADISELFNAVSFDSDEEKRKVQIPWKLIGSVLGGVLGLVVVGISGVFAWPHISSYLAQITAPSISQTNIPPQAPNVVTPTAPITHSTTNQTGNTAPIVAVTPPKPISRPIQDRLRSGGKGPQMLKILAGRFSMGSKARLGSLGRKELPIHDVNIRTFYMARYETSFDEYNRFVRARGHRSPSDAGFGRGNRPVINVSWKDAQAYVQWLASETGRHYYLPSEAQWEYAAKGGTKTYYWWGSKLKRGYAVCFGCGTAWDNRSTAPVGSIRPNAFGLYDTSGNVMEWVQDCYNTNYQGAPDDGRPWLSGDCSQHMVRGGAFNKPITSARNSTRSKLPTEGRFNMLGFRVARD